MDRRNFLGAAGAAAATSIATGRLIASESEPVNEQQPHRDIVMWVWSVPGGGTLVWQLDGRFDGVAASEALRISLANWGLSTCIAMAGPNFIQLDADYLWIIGWSALSVAERDQALGIRLTSDICGDPSGRALEQLAKLGTVGCIVPSTMGPCSLSASGAWRVFDPVAPVQPTAINPHA